MFSNGNEILIEDHYVLDEMVPTRLVIQGLARLLLRVLRVLATIPDRAERITGFETSDVFRIGAAEGEEINEDVHGTLFAEAGDDTVYIGGGITGLLAVRGYTLHLCW